MKNLRVKALIICTGISILGTSKTFAINLTEINNSSLEFHNSRYSWSDEKLAYMLKKGIDKETYNKYIELSKQYRFSKENKWESIENGTLIIYDILFASKEIKDEVFERENYESSLENIHNSIKKDILNNPTYILDIIKNTIQNPEQIKDIFISKYDRKPSTDELTWLTDEKTMKYAIYGGELGRPITTYEYSLINNGYGYKLLALNSTEIENYTEYISIREKIIPIELKYYKTVDSFKNVYIDVLNKYKKNIYTELSSSERETIFLNSIEGIQINNNTLYSLTIKKLKEKNIINSQVSEESQNDKVEHNEDNKKPIKQDSSSSNPYNDLTHHLNGGTSNIRDTLLLDINKNYNIQKIQHINNLRNTYIYFRYKDTVVNTYIRLPISGEFNIANFKTLTDSIKKELNSKMIFSKKRLLFFIENELKTSLFNSSNEISLNDVINGFKGVGIYIYEKTFLESNDTNTELNTDVNVEKTYMQVDLDKESFIVPMLQNQVFNREFKEFIEKLGMKYVFTTDSVLILYQGKIFTINSNAYNNGYVTIEEVNDFLSKVNIEATIKIINRKEQSYE